MGDGSEAKAPATSDTPPGTKSARDVPVAPLAEGVPSADKITRPVLAGVGDPVRTPDSRSGRSRYSCLMLCASMHVSYGVHACSRAV